jgi:hypothetical protein
MHTRNTWTKLYAIGFYQKNDYQLVPNLGGNTNAQQSHELKSKAIQHNVQL